MAVTFYMPMKFVKSKKHFSLIGINSYLDGFFVTTSHNPKSCISLLVKGGSCTPLDWVGAETQPLCLCSFYSDDIEIFSKTKEHFKLVCLDFRKFLGLANKTLVDGQLCLECFDVKKRDVYVMPHAVWGSYMVFWVVSWPPNPFANYWEQFVALINST